MLTNLPDLGRSARILKISLNLESVPCTTLIGIAIQKGLRENNLRGTIAMIKDNAKDNRDMVADILGGKLLKEIESL